MVRGVRMPEITFGAPTDRCVWLKENWCNYVTSCGADYSIGDEHEEEGFIFCPYCARPVERREPATPEPEPKMPVTINFLVDPAPAMIWVNDVYLGVSPLTLKEVVPGTMRVKAVATGYKLWEFTYTGIMAGARLTITIGLDKMEEPQR